MSMSYQPTFTSWQNLTLEDLMMAYRKAKANCCSENSFSIAIQLPSTSKIGT